tara:strand:+ start:2263 stop:2652 length:390 start_codon:yes stop_codon:yes gene_type:complete
VARNPFAREVARGELAKELVKHKIALYMMEDGEECNERIEGLGLTLSIIGTAANIDPKILPHDHRLKILRGGLGACQQIINAGTYDTNQTVAICQALDQAVLLNKSISAASLQKAFILCQGPSLQPQPP